MNHPALMINHAPRRYLVSNGVTYDLQDSVNRCYWFYTNERISTVNWDGIAFAMERLRFERVPDMTMALPPPVNGQDLAWIPVDRWLALHGVRAPMMQQPVDLTYSDSEPGDLEMLEALQDVEDAHAVWNLLREDDEDSEVTPLGYFDDLDSDTDDEVGF